MSHTSENAKDSLRLGDPPPECPELDGKHFSEKTIKLIRRTYNRFQFDPNLRNKLSNTEHTPHSTLPSSAPFDPISNLYIAPTLPQQPNIRPPEVQIRQSQNFSLGDSKEMPEDDVDVDPADLGMKMSDLNLSAEEGKESESEASATENTENDHGQYVEKWEREREKEDSWKDLADKLSLSPTFLEHSGVQPSEVAIPRDDLNSVQDLVELHYKQLQEFYRDDA